PAGSPVPACQPIFCGCRFLKALEFSEFFESFVYQLPSTGNFLVDLAFSVRRAAAWAIEYALGTSGDRADTAGAGENTCAACLASLGPHTFFFGCADKAGIYTGENTRSE